MAVAAPAGAQQPDQQALDAYQRALDSLVPALLEELATPGAAVALIRDGRVVVSKGYGWADRDAERRVTTSTMFNIGSISKTVAAWGLMRLVEDGKLALDTPVDQYLTRWHLPPSEFDHDEVTLRRLLSHTAGLRLHGYPGFDPSETLPSVERSLSGATNGSGDVRVIMEPGTKWQYSGGGFTIAQLLVEEVTGRPFNDYMQAEILEPLGMTSSSYVWDEIVAARAATPYGPLGPIPGPRFTAQAAASLQTSLDEFVRFALASMSSARAEFATEVLPPDVVAVMQEPVAPSSDYGLGYGVTGVLDGHRAVGHGGANAGWMARFLVVPRLGEGLVVMTNSTLGGEVHRYLFCQWGHAALAESGPCRRGVGAVVVSTIARDGLDAAIARYWELRQDLSDRYDLGEFQLNGVGYALLGAGRIEEAVAIFKANVEAFPDAWNPYDSLGEAYMIAGEDELAIANYRRSLELNPENENAVEMLKRLEGR
jgi:CubicO group peptidase (beta-lactamase class C family)